MRLLGTIKVGAETYVFVHDGRPESIDRLRRTLVAMATAHRISMALGVALSSMLMIQDGDFVPKCPHCGGQQAGKRKDNPRCVNGHVYPVEEGVLL